MPALFGAHDVCDHCATRSEEAALPNESKLDRWEYPPHTKAKHDILDSYLGGWFPILTARNQRVVFFDGFAGRGRYNDGTEGSPLLAIRKLVQHRHSPQMRDNRFTFIFVEKHPKNAAALEEALDDLKSEFGGFPDNITVHVIKDHFDEAARRLVATAEEQKRNLAPTFAFIDPFGYSGVPMDVISNLVQYPRCEVFINFMVGHVQRFIERAGQEDAMQSLFGIPVEDVMAEYTSDSKRVEHLRDVYMTQLRDMAGFKYIVPFEMVGANGNVAYYLLYGTNHLKGLRLMKDAMWKVDPASGGRFSDRLAGQQALFISTADLTSLREALTDHFAGVGAVRIEDVEEFVLAETIYRQTHVRGALRPMEKEGEIAVNRVGKKGFFPPGTTITFV